MIVSGDRGRFEMLARGVNVQPLLDKLGANPQLWGHITDRQTTPGSPHHDTECIFVRWPEDQSLEAAFYDLSCIDYPDAQTLMPEVGQVFMALSESLGGLDSFGAIGRIIIVKLKAGGVIDAHSDEGTYADFYDRFHICLSGSAEFGVDARKMKPLPGDIFWMNHKRQHWVDNTNGGERIHMIVDLECPKAKAMRGLCFQQERQKDLWDEITPLLEQHWKEIAHYPEFPLDPDRTRYANMEEAGLLRVYTARLNGVLIGYIVYLLGAHLHYQSMLVASQDVLYVSPDYRKGRAGIGLIRYAEKRLAAEGVNVTLQHTKAAHDIGPLLEKMGYELMDKIYTKRL